uniref:GMEB1/2/Spe-44-like domain-containing protein n=1 Tax=Oryzias latipes TaxID=8090 RepID=A0A3P9JMM8_ORYLA
MLRKMMDSGEIDFYRHNHMCSNTCRSTKFNVLTNGPRPSMGTPMQPGSSCVAPMPSGGQVPPMTAEGRLENESRATAGWSSGLPRLVHFTASSWHSLKRKRADTPDGVLRLWRGVADSGLMGEVLSSVQSELLTALQRVELCREKADLQEADTFMLNSLCEMFGLLDSVKQTVDIRCMQSEDSKIHHRVYGEKAAESQYTERSAMQLLQLISCFSAALNDILGEGSKLSCRSYTNSSSKQCRRTQRDTAKTNTGICSLSDVDLGSASHNGIFPQSSSFTDPRVGASKACRDGQGSLREHEVSRAGKQETAQRQEDTLVNGQRSDKLLGLCQLKREDIGDKESPSKSIKGEEEKHKNMAKM